MPRYIVLLILLCATALTGCSTSIGSATSSLFGGSKTETSSVTPAPAPPASTPTARALNVGAVTARALKCGYNFDPSRLKATYVADETARGTPANDLANIEKAYNIGFNGVNKVASTEANYCSSRKTDQIKADLGQLLAGNFEPPTRKPEQPAEEGVFGGLFGGEDASSEGVSTPLPLASGN